MNDIEKIQTQSQKCLQSFPTVVVGSGYSAGHGLATMSQLASHLVGSINSQELSTDDKISWESLKKSLGSLSLEEALTKHQVSDSLLVHIIEQTWKLIASKDREIKFKCIETPRYQSLSRLLEYLFTSSNNTAHIVTTNYDRLVEYAAESMGYIASTGFLPGTIGTREEDLPLKYLRDNAHVREVKVWKVHGSIDWFQTNGVIVRTETEHTLKTLRPMMITPGIEKYQRALREPFRSILAGADKSLSHATSFLCIGYGFNDEHIQEKLVESVQRQGKSLIILARKLTDATKSFLKTLKTSEYIAAEEEGDGTRIFNQDQLSGIVFPKSQIWDLNHFLKWSIEK